MSKELKTRNPHELSGKLARVAPIFASAGVLVTCLFFGPEAPHAQGTELLSRPLYGVFLAIALVALWIEPTIKRDWKVKPSVWWWIDVIVCTYAIVPILQFIVPSPRPPGSPIEELLGLPIGGWPSGHMVSMFAMAWVLMVARPRMAWFAFALAVMVGWARLESSAHYPIQVISGSALGLALGWWITQHKEGLLMPRLFDAIKRKLPGRNPIK